MSTTRRQCGTRGGRAAVASGALLAVAVSLLAGCEELQNCNPIGCPPRVSIKADIPPTPGVLDVEVCENGACTATTLQAGDDGGVSHRAGVFDFYARSDAMGATNQIQVTAYDGASAPRNGDRYALKVIAAESGETLLEEARTVTYEVTHPSGPDCGECRSAAPIELSAP